MSETTFSVVVGRKQEEKREDREGGEKGVGKDNKEFGISCKATHQEA